MKFLIRVAVIFFVPLFLQAQGQWTTPALIDSGRHPSIDGGQIAIDDNGNIFSAYSTNAYGALARSTDNGSTWQQFTNPGFRGSVRGTVIDHRGIVWVLSVASSGEFTPSYVYLSKSIDSGRTFTTFFSSLSYADGTLYERLAVDAQNSIYMLWDDRHFKLTKFRHGDIEQRVDAEIPRDTLGISDHPSLVISNDFVVHCAWEGFSFDSTGHQHIYYTCSLDTGTTFGPSRRIDTTEINLILDNQHYPSITTDSSGEVFISYTQEFDFGGRNQIRMTHTANHGESFDPPVVISGTDTVYNSLISTDSRKGVHVIWSAQSFLRYRQSTDQGLSFGQTSRLGQMFPHDLKANKNGFLYAAVGSDSGLCVMKRLVFLSVRRAEEIPRAFGLSQNYPNPFNPTTNLTFSIDKAGFVELKIYDVSGRTVATVVSKHLAAGNYSVTWNAAGLGTGVYFAHITSNNGRTATRKMILVR